jgi:hypothetical protein
MSAENFDPATYLANRGSSQASDMAPLQGQVVAWSVDGKRALAHAPTWEELWAQIDQLGLSDLEYVVGGVPILDQVQMGGIDT